MFDGVEFKGQVTEVFLDSRLRTYQMHVDYEDGDVDDFDEWELKQFLRMDVRMDV